MKPAAANKQTSKQTTNTLNDLIVRSRQSDKAYAIEARAIAMGRLLGTYERK